MSISCCSANARGAGAAGAEVLRGADQDRSRCNPGKAFRHCNRSRREDALTMACQGELRHVGQLRTTQLGEKLLFAA
jgi:hypothetical protein